jgi:hypothetical protein
MSSQPLRILSVILLFLLQQTSFYHLYFIHYLVNFIISFSAFIASLGKLVIPVFVGEWCLITQSLDQYASLII